MRTFVLTTCTKLWWALNRSRSYFYKEVCPKCLSEAVVEVAGEAVAVADLEDEAGVVEGIIRTWYPPKPS